MRLSFLFLFFLGTVSVRAADPSEMGPPGGKVDQGALRGVSADRPFPLPGVDLSRDGARQTVIAAGTAEIYQGHPTAVLLPDGKTIYCVWTIGHAGPCGPLKRSDDGGKSWSDLLPTPDNWPQTKNCPAIYRLTDPQGTARLFIYPGNGPGAQMHESHSEDDGKTWSPMKGIGLPSVNAFTTIVPVDGGKRLLAMASIRRSKQPEDKWSNLVAQTESTDGGFTWAPWRKIYDDPALMPCEPALIRSPDGKQLLCLMRENVKRQSLYMTSDDEGATWSVPKPTPIGLVGDRHVPVYAPDGRLVVFFRDRALQSGMTGHFVAWVGRYQDIVEGKEGEYRIKLLHSYKGTDCGYPGVVLLPDGTFVAITYIKYHPGPELNSVVGTRFTLDEVDKMPKALPPPTTKEPSAAPAANTDL